MGRLLKNWLIILVAAIALRKLSEARAKADIWGDDYEDDEDNWWGKYDSSENKEVHSTAVPKSTTEPQHYYWYYIGQQGINYVYYNETCSATKICIKNANMECSTSDGTGRCQCLGQSVYVHATNTCLKIILSSREECAYDIQCQAGRWGQLSRCNKQTARCECYHWSVYFMETVRSEDGICFIKKSVGDICDTDEECNKPIPGEAYCLPGQYKSSAGKGYKGSCQCKEVWTWHEPSGKCLLKATKLGDPCEVSDQCRDGSLGKLSTCDRDTGKCVCMNFGGALNSTKIIYGERLHKCFFKKEYNDTCREDDECRASLGPDVECGPTDYTYDYVCHCPQGKVCKILRSNSNNTEGIDYDSLKLVAGIVIAVIVFVAVCCALWFCRPECVFGKLQQRKNAGISSGNGTTTVSNEQTSTFTANASAPSTTMDAVNLGIIKPYKYKSGCKSNPVQQSDLAEPLLLPRQPIQHAHSAQPMNFGNPSTNGPQIHPQELPPPYPGLPRDQEFLNLPNNPYFTGE